MRKKICHISTVHSALDVRIFYRECKHLAENNYDVTLIAKHQQNEVIDDVNIVRFPETNSRLVRVFILSFYMFYMALRQKADIYHFHDPELMFIGFLLRLLGKRVVYDVHEDLPKQVYNKTYVNKSLKPILSFLIKKTEAFFTTFYDGVVTVVPSIYDRFIQNNKQTIMFRNFPDIKQIDKIEAVKKERDKFVIIYPGSLSKIRGVGDLIKVVEHFHGKVELWLFGKWVNKSFENHCASLAGWKYTKYFGRKPLDEVYKYIKVADMGAHIIHDVPSHRIGYPVKGFDFMACQKSFIVSDIGNKRELFDEYALFVEPGNIEDIKQKIVMLMEDKKLSLRLAEQGRIKIEESYNIDNEVKALLNFYEHILRR